MLLQTRFQASGSPGSVFEVPGRQLPEAPAGDSDETVSKSSAGTSKTHETVSKKSDGRPEAYDSARDRHEKEASGAPLGTQ